MRIKKEFFCVTGNFIALNITMVKYHNVLKKCKVRWLAKKVQRGDDARYYNNYNGGMMLVI